ncbi:MAG: glycosyltransferase family A protein [Cyanobacteria bacterium P01_G01_bin.38]
MNRKNACFLSIIIPVYNDVKRLQLCLDSLENQTLPRHQYEIIVVDNNSQDDIKTAVQNFDQVMLAYEPLPGSYLARNKGISLAKGDILAFTDSDCIPAKDWLEKGSKHLLSIQGCGFVAGNIKFFFDAHNQPNPIELYDSLVNLQQKKYLEEQGWGATANLFTFKDVFDDVGLFNVHLKSGGDAEWGKRVSSRGYNVIYAEDCCIRHPARSSLKEIYKKIQRTMSGVYAISQTSQNQQVRQLFAPNDNPLTHSLLTQLRPPLRSAFQKSYQDRRLKKIHEKTTIFLLIFLLHYLKVFELFRLKTGKFQT